MIEIEVLVPECNEKVIARIRSAALKTLEITGNVKKNQLTILIGSDEYIQELNKTYRNVDRTTDVLSFSEDYTIPGSTSTYLGDIAISFPTANRQADEAGHPIEDELSLLAIHGVLHLLGYDHHEDAEKAEMWKIQQQVLNALGIIMDHFSGDE